MGLFDFLKPRTTPPTQSVAAQGIPKLVRERIIHVDGRQVFAIIHNGDYFLTTMPIYEDGVVDCWDCVDLAGMTRKVEKGWVSAQVPEGEWLSIFHLAQVKVMAGEWTHTQETYMAFVESVVKEMNPRMENLYVAGREQNKVVGNTTYPRMGASGAILRQDPGPLTNQQVKGNQMSLFYKHKEGIYYLVELVVYADAKILVVGGPEQWFLSRPEVLKWGARGALATDLPAGSTLVIDGVGKFVVGDCESYVELGPKMGELDDMISTLNKQPDTSDRCLEAYRAWKADPSDTNLERLRVAYNRVPEHLRPYILGDMGDKDAPIRAALDLN